MAQDAILPADLVTRVNDADVVFFLGAGCSMEPPASLPSAPELAESLIERGFGKSGYTLEQVAEECASKGRNILSEALPKAEWRAKPCNVAHRVVAQLAKEGLLSEVVTTNWDTLIEHGIRRAGVPFTPVVNPQLLREGGLAGGVRVAKIHGCIEHPETPLLATPAELAEWSAEWAKVLFEYLARTRTFVFVGYSGAAASVTITLAAIAQADESAGRDYVVDPKGLQSIADTEQGHAFVTALGGDKARFIEMTSTDFFSALRVEVFPLLLVRPWNVCRTRILTLCQGTRIEPSEIEPVVAAVFDAWKEMGPDRAQALLSQMLPGLVQMGLDDPYVPLVPNSEPLALVLLARALLLWAGAAVLEAEVLYSTEPTRSGVSFLALSAGVERRDVVGIRAVSDYANDHPDVDQGIVAIVFGDIGPLPEAQLVNPSVARPSAGPSVVRPLGPRCAWLSGADLLSTFGKDMGTDTLKGRIVGLLRDKATELQE